MNTENELALKRAYKERLLNELSSYSILLAANKGIFGNSAYRTKATKKINRLLFDLNVIDKMLSQDPSF